MLQMRCAVYAVWALLALKVIILGQTGFHKHFVSKAISSVTP